MSRKIFGTDGVRGRANTYPMTPDVILKLAVATGQHFMTGDHRHTVVIGKDTRLSGYMVEPALTSGFIAAGMDVILVGPLPTPAVAMLTRSMRADLGVMISASHNPYQDNGIKFFCPNGLKLSDEAEKEIEDKVLSADFPVLAAPEMLGKAERLENARGRYIEFVKHTLPRNARFEGLKVVLDCAHGAAYNTAPKVLWELGAEVVIIGDQPDGFNINKDCGATATKLLQEKVLEHNADIGIALDGDADRLILVDEKGEKVDGDQILALLATHWQKSGFLQGDGIVATVMSNLGLELYLKTLGLKLNRSNVGDRYVASDMRRLGCNIGGEQSGHLILRDFVTTGDGLVAALQVLHILAQESRKASELCRVFETVPQVLKNVRIVSKDPMDCQSVQKVISEAEEKLKTNGRILIRKSGTEPLLRVMGECTDEALLKQVIDSIVETIEKSQAA